MTGVVITKHRERAPTCARNAIWIACRVSVAIAPSDISMYRREWASGMPQAAPPYGFRYVRFIRANGSVQHVLVPSSQPAEVAAALAEEQARSQPEGRYVRVVTADGKERGVYVPLSQPAESAIDIYRLAQLSAEIDVSDASVVPSAAHPPAVAQASPCAELPVPSLATPPAAPPNARRAASLPPPAASTSHAEASFASMPPQPLASTPHHPFAPTPPEPSASTLPQPSASTPPQTFASTHTRKTTAATSVAGLDSTWTLGEWLSSLALHEVPCSTRSRGRSLLGRRVHWQHARAAHRRWLPRRSSQVRGRTSSATRKASTQRAFTQRPDRMCP